MSDWMLHPAWLLLPNLGFLLFALYAILDSMPECVVWDLPIKSVMDDRFTQACGAWHWAQLKEAAK